MRAKNKELLITTIFLAFAIFAFPHLSLAGPVPDTGQTLCYDNSGEIPCPNPGQSFYGQDAQYSMYPQSYTKLDEDGLELPDSATEWVMVRDNITGLIWEVKQDKDEMENYDNPHDANNRYNWQDAQDIFIATLNSQQFGGYNDWRLPTVKELPFIKNMDTQNPSINTTYFPNPLSMASYWTSTTNADNPYYAWFVHFFFGGIVDIDDKSASQYVRAVRAF